MELLVTVYTTRGNKIKSDTIFIVNSQRIYSEMNIRASKIMFGDDTLSHNFYYNIVRSEALSTYMNYMS